MFEERGADEVTEFRPYRATTWQRVSEERHSEESTIETARETTSSPGNFFNVISDLLKPIRKFVSEHEAWLLIAVVLLLVCDCEDDLELLIAIAILLLPTLSRWF